MKPSYPKEPRSQTERNRKRTEAEALEAAFASMFGLASVYNGKLRKQSANGGGDILVVCGGVIPPKDYDELKAAGVAAIFGPGTNIPHAARAVLELIRRRGDAAA